VITDYCLLITEKSLPLAAPLPDWG